MEILRGERVTAAEVVPGVENSRFGEGSEMSLIRYEISPGERVPEHSHPHEQVGYVLAGHPTVIQAEQTTMAPGDGYVIPGGERHGFANETDSPVVGIDVFSPPRAVAPFAAEK
jgi:quercetin dioxygenase-like cupin family protein